MALKLIHTADWHLGQTFFGYDREAEHEAFLGFLTNLLVERQTDRGIVVAGDDHDLQARIQAIRLPQETIETALRPRGRVRHVEHIAGDQQDIRLPLHQ